MAAASRSQNRAVGASHSVSQSAGLGWTPRRLGPQPSRGRLVRVSRRTRETCLAFTRGGLLTIWGWSTLEEEQIHPGGRWVGRQ